MTSAQAIEVLRTKARALYTALDEHMRFEEGLLETALREVIGRGAELHAELERDHQRQRAILTSAIADLACESPSREELVTSVRRFLDLLLRDLDDEERVLLSADIDALRRRSPEAQIRRTGSLQDRTVIHSRHGGPCFIDLLGRPH